MSQLPPLNPFPSHNAWHHPIVFPHRSLVQSNFSRDEGFNSELLHEVLHALPQGLAQCLKASLSIARNGVVSTSHPVQAKTKGNCDPHCSGPIPRREDILPEELFGEKSNGTFAGNQETNPKGKPFVTLRASQIRKKQKELEQRALVGLLAGPRSHVETLRNWIRSQWEPLVAEVETIQALPKGHYLFVFKNADTAFFVLSHGQWVIRPSPLSLFRWNKDFNPERSALVNCPVWVEFPNLPMHYHSLLAEIGSSLGKVLKGCQKTNYVPSWHPQVLIEMDISVELPSAIDIFKDDGELFEQLVTYKYLPNTCLHCGDRSHFVRNCPIKFPPAPQPNQATKVAKETDSEGFTTVSHNKGKDAANHADKGKDKLKGRTWQPNRRLRMGFSCNNDPKKNGKWRVYVDYKPLNAATKRDHIPFQDEILNEVASFERYIVCDGYSRYYQIKIAEEDQKKTTFVTPWGCFAYRVMPFGLTNAPATFQIFVTHVF
ncbi:hypothetical protein L7F22_022498 [Adiantum nelumboides]|nr:hypothetical protein [Adiantum nelumboides]